MRAGGGISNHQVIHARAGSIMNNKLIELDETNFEREVLGARDPVLVQFWVSWSELCRAMTPVLESVASEGSICAKVGRVNVEQHEDLADQYGVRALPTLLIFKQGGLQDQIIGRTTEREVREKLVGLR
jgi:thioredoxin 1